MFALAPLVASAADGLIDALAGAQARWVLVAVALHLANQLARAFAWHAALSAYRPGVGRGRACRWYLCGAGLSGILSGRGGDAVRLALAKRELPGSTWPALIGTTLVEGGSQALISLPLALVAVGVGVGMFGLPSPAVAGAIALIGLLAVALAARSPRVRGLLGEVARGASALRRPRRFLGPVLAWQLLARALRLLAIACFLHAFGLPTGVVVVIVVSVVYGSGSALPIPGAGTAAAAGALLVALPLAAGQSVDAAAVSALVMVQPAVLTIAGVSISLVLLASLLGAQTPRGLLRSVRALARRVPESVPEPVLVPPAKAPA